LVNAGPPAASSITHQFGLGLGAAVGVDRSARVLLRRGTIFGRPYTAVDEMCTTRSTCADRAAASTVSVPATITDLICAAG
jgi:hypothetical protein